MVGSIYNMANVHVHAPDREVIRRVESMLVKEHRRCPDPVIRAERHRLYRGVLKVHREARELFDYYRF